MIKELLKEAKNTLSDKNKEDIKAWAKKRAEDFKTELYDYTDDVITDDMYIGTSKNDVNKTIDLLVTEMFIQFKAEIKKIK